MRRNLSLGDRKRRKAARETYEQHLKDIETSLALGAQALQDSPDEISRSRQLIDQINGLNEEREREK